MVRQELEVCENVSLYYARGINKSENVSEKYCVSFRSCATGLRRRWRGAFCPESIFIPFGEWQCDARDAVGARR